MKIMLTGTRLVLALLILGHLASANLRQRSEDGRSRHFSGQTATAQNDFVVTQISKRVEPILPAEARPSRKRGAVLIQITVDEAGNIADARALAGPRPLRDAATEAVRQWRFEPARSNGTPVRALGLVTFCFSRDGKLSTSKYTFNFQECCPGSLKNAKHRCP
jgi:TonB family protein